MKISEFLMKDVDKYKAAYESCDKYQKIHYKSYLKKYEWQFEKRSEFLNWYLKIVN